MAVLPEQGLLELTAPQELEPGIPRLWRHFSEIAQTPRMSRAEGPMIDLVTKFATDRSLAYERDKAGNVLITVPATPGFEDKPGVVIQAHMDMVCIPKGDEGPAKKGVRPMVDETGEWVHANGTTLGADNGIGFAAGLSIIDENMDHGPLKFLATVDEETGLNGAGNMSFTDTDTTGDMYLINLDTEEGDELIVGCGGAGNSEITLPISVESIGDKRLIRVPLKNLPGGHSGLVIAEDRPNAIKVLADGLTRSLEQFPTARLVSINGGNARNAIPKDAVAVIAVDPNETAIGSVVREGDPDVMFTRESTDQVLALIEALPHGVERMSEDVPGLPQTSTNLALVETGDNGVVIQMMTRSMDDADLEAFRDRIREIAELNGASVEQNEAYPGWKPELGGELITLVQSEFAALTDGAQLKVGATHAGLECGTILAHPKFAHMQAVSFGPTIHGAHTTEEKVSIESTAQTYRLLKNVIAKIAA